MKPDLGRSRSSFLHLYRKRRGKLIVVSFANSETMALEGIYILKYFALASALFIESDLDYIPHPITILFFSPKYGWSLKKDFPWLIFIRRCKKIFLKSSYSAQKPINENLSPNTGFCFYFHFWKALLMHFFAFKSLIGTSYR